MLTLPQVLSDQALMLQLYSPMENKQGKNPRPKAQLQTVVQCFKNSLNNVRDNTNYRP